MSSKYERELRTILRKYGYLVIRSAGSFVIDLVAIPKLFCNIEDIKFIEEKSTHGKSLYISNTEKSKRQFDENKRIYNEYNIEIVYAVRFISAKAGKNWRIFEIDYEEDGYPIFKEDKGIKLKDWLE